MSQHHFCSDMTPAAETSQTRSRSCRNPREDNSTCVKKLSTLSKTQSKQSMDSFKCFIPTQALRDILGIVDAHSLRLDKPSTSIMTDKINHLLVQVENEKGKLEALLKLLPELLLLNPRTVIFCETEGKAKNLYDILQQERMQCILVHDHLNLTWEMDKRKLSRLVVATDVILKWSLESANIINFDPPSTVATYGKRAAFASRCHEFKSSSKAQPKPVVINFEASEDDRTRNSKVKRDLQIKFQDI